MDNKSDYIEPGKFCKTCVYNIYKKGNLCNTYPCGMSKCKPMLEGKTTEMNENKSSKKYNNVGLSIDLGNGYKHSIQPTNSVKVSGENKLFKNDRINVKEVTNMSEELSISKKAIGVDIGTAFIVSGLYNQNDEIVTKSVRDGFFKLETSKQKKNMLDSSGVNYIKMDDYLYVVGNEAFDMAVLFEQTLRRPLKDGVLSATEKESEIILKEILKQVVGKCDSNDILYYSVPANPVDSNFDIIYHEAKFKTFFEELGLKNINTLNEAMAIVNAELADKMFTGLAISFGAGMTNVAMSYRGLEIFSFSVARGGDWIDNEVAQNRQISLSDATATKEDENFNLLNPKDIIEDAIRIFYNAHLDYVINHIRKNLELHSRKIKLKEPLKVVLSGGTSKPKGFIELFKKKIADKPLNISIGDIVQASNTLDAVARGCLIAAKRDLLDSEEA
ncbi:MAG: cell division FtsA domain-containing protein [Methanothrix sp.]|nr:cell division FtsA domain-containing protein [Methanothrix sp.]